MLDNLESHISVEAINLCRENGVSLLTFPPHCSHRLQPLDVAVYGPLKTLYNNACTTWLHTNPAIPMTIFNISQCFGEAYPLAFCPRNIISGFQATQIWPFNRDVFVDADFTAASVTDRELPSTPDDATSPAVTETTRSSAKSSGLQQA